MRFHFNSGIFSIMASDLLTRSSCLLSMASLHPPIIPLKVQMPLHHSFLAFLPLGVFINLQCHLLWLAQLLTMSMISLSSMASSRPTKTSLSVPQHPSKVPLRVYNGSATSNPMDHVPQAPPTPTTSFIQLMQSTK